MANNLKSISIHEDLVYSNQVFKIDDAERIEILKQLKICWNVCKWGKSANKIACYEYIYQICFNLIKM